MSPGLFALGPGKFSHKGVNTTKLILEKKQVIGMWIYSVSDRTG